MTYPDVTAEDFLFVQMDIDYRKEWDNTAVALDVIETDVAQGSNSQVMYWEMLWPVSKILNSKELTLTVFFLMLEIICQS